MNPSASALDRVEACPASHTLTPRAEETSEYADIGNAIHEFCRRVATTDNYELALSCVPMELQDRCKGIDFNSILEGLAIVGAEEAYAVDIDTGSIVYLGSNIGRDYAGAMQRKYGRDLLPTEICTTLDVEAVMTANGTPVAIDWKSGNSIKPCSEMLQMWIQDYVLAVKYNASESWGWVCYLDESGRHDIDKHLFNRMDLDGLPQRLATILARIRVATRDNVYPGDHCRYCPALRGCPAQTAMVKAMLGDIRELEVAFLAPEDVGRAYHKLKMIGNLYDKVEKSLKTMIVQLGEVPADNDNYVYKQTENSKTYIPADLARGMLITLNATPAQIDSVTKKTTYPVIRRVKKNG